jgi:hypothetical protein
MENFAQLELLGLLTVLVEVIELPEPLLLQNVQLENTYH